MRLGLGKLRDGVFQLLSKLSKLDSWTAGQFTVSKLLGDCIEEEEKEARKLGRSLSSVKIASYERSAVRQVSHNP